MSAVNKPQRGEQWHIGKEIPIALVIGMLAQFGAWIWQAATVSTKLDDLSLQVASLAADKYTKNDAAKDGALSIQRMNDLERRINNLERRR